MRLNSTNGTWQESDYDITITNRSTVGVTAVLSYTNLEDFDYGLVFTESTMNNATFNGTNTVVLENPITLGADENGVYTPSSAVITVTPDANKAVPEEDSASKVGTITVTLSVTSAAPQEPEGVNWQEANPIPLCDYYTNADAAVDAKIGDRGNYDIGTASQFSVTLTPPVLDMYSYEITKVEGKYLDGTDCSLSISGETIINEGAAGTYYVKVTVEETDTMSGESTTKYAYLLIKQDAAP